jgi:hypothetical protein
MARTHRGGALALVCAALLCLGRGSSAALLVRPEQDCINPSVSKVNEFDFFPDDFRSIISEPSPVAPGATVRRRQRPRGAAAARML